MLPAEIASTTVKPSMILERNRKVGSLKNEPLSFWNRTFPPVFVLKNRHRGPNPNAVRKCRAEWIRVRKYGQKRQWVVTSPAPRGGGSTRIARCVAGWGDRLSAY